MYSAAVGRKLKIVNLELDGEENAHGMHGPLTS